MLSGGNDLQHAGIHTVIFSSGYGSARGYFINPENVWQIAIVFSVRRLVKSTWLNDRDQFLQPTKPLSNEFKSDCLVWMLFNGSNLTAGANGLEWNSKKWSIVNHFIPFTEAEVNAPARFESDFMVQYISSLPVIARRNDEAISSTSSVIARNEAISTDKQIASGKNPRNDEATNSPFSAEANNVLKQGKLLWQAYFAHIDERDVRDELKLNRADVGWYQVRKALQARNAGSDFAPVSFKPFEEAYKALTEKLQPMVYELGFLKV